MAHPWRSLRQKARTSLRYWLRKIFPERRIPKGRGRPMAESLFTPANLEGLRGLRLTPMQITDFTEAANSFMLQRQLGSNFVNARIKRAIRDAGVRRGEIAYRYLRERLFEDPRTYAKHEVSRREEPTTLRRKRPPTRRITASAGK